MDLHQILCYKAHILTRYGVYSMVSKNSHPGHRDSKSGQFVTEKYAGKHPKTTQKESIPNSGRGDTGRGGGKRRG